MTVGMSEQKRTPAAEGGSLVRSDWSAVVILFFIALAMRIPFRSHFAYHWDSAQFVLAIRQFDIRLSQPHPPGYFLYVMLGRLVNYLVGDPHASLVWISVVFGSALPPLLYLLATSMFGRWAGAAAAGMALTSPQMWFHSCVALTYIVDSFLVCAVVLVLWLAMRHGGRWRDAIMAGGLLALVGGVREQTVPALMPLVVFACWRFQQARIAKLAATAVVALGFGVLWFMPMVRLSGGLRTYLDVVHLQAVSDALTNFPGGGLNALLKNVANITGFCGNGLMLGAVVLVVALLRRAVRMTVEQKNSWDRQHAPGLVVLAFWVVPFMILGTVAGASQPGHVLSYLPGWFVLVGVLVASLTSKWQRAAVITGICAVNVISFVASPAVVDRAFFGMARTAHEIASHDAQLSEITATMRRSFTPKDVAICYAEEYYLWGIRHFQIYLPEYDQYQLVTDATVLHPPGKSMWRVRDGRLGFVDKPDLHGKTGVVLFVPPGEGVEIFASYLSVASMRALSRKTNNLYFLPASEMKPSESGMGNAWRP